LLPLLYAGIAHVQDYPAQPARIVVGYAHGGANDLIARIAAQKLTEHNMSRFSLRLCGDAVEVFPQATPA
jgi:tripartite-type tricarboxylate transporter receptor subunit TctC